MSFQERAPENQSLGTVLIVDDQVSNRYVLSRILRTAGYQILEAARGQEAIELSKTNPDIIILDVKLPDISGYEVCQKIKDSEATCRIPIIQTSASYVDGEDHLKGVDSGADAYLVAPIDPHVLLSTVKSWLRVSRAEKAREKLQLQSLKDLSAFFLQSPTPMAILTGPEHRFSLANGPYEALVGMKVVGRTVKESFPEEDILYFLKVLDEVYQTGVSYIAKEVPFRLPDSRKVFLDVGYHVYRNENDQVQGILAEVRDVTVEVEAREEIERVTKDLILEKEKLEAIFNDSPAAMAIFRGEDLVVEKVNPRYGAIFGNRPLLGKRLIEAVPELEGQVFIDLLQKVLKTGETFTATEIFAQLKRSEDGPIEDLYYDLNYIQLNDPNGLPYGVYNFSIDVTERVKNRSLIEEHKKSLETTITNLSQERELRERFVAALTHDLRTPLTSARLTAQILGRKLSADQTVQNATQKIISSMDRADHMIRDLLDSSFVNVGGTLPLDVKEHEIRDIVEGVVDDLTTLHGERMRSNILKDIQGFWDSTAIRRIIENLGNNAVKYGAENAPVTISASTQDNFITLQVHNEGRPIPPEDAKNIFQPFRRTDSAFESKQKGWGIGLTLVKGLAEAHGGSVQLKSDLETGTTFTVLIPIDARKESSQHLS